MHRVILVGFDGAQGLDIFGPAEVFAGAGRLGGGEPYHVVLASARGGRTTVTSGLVVRARPIARIRPRSSDTVLVVGGSDAGVRRAVGSTELVAWVGRASRVVRRVGSVCSGAFFVCPSESGVCCHRSILSKSFRLINSKIQPNARRGCWPCNPSITSVEQKTACALGFCRRGDALTHRWLGNARERSRANICGDASTAFRSRRRLFPAR